MLGSKKIACIIPARLASTRFPEKMLTTLCGKPLLQWVWEAAKAVPCFDECHFAVDDVKIAALLDSFGASWFMTAVDAQCGTDRLAEVMERGLVTADVWVNWQGDEPFINAAMIADLLQSIEQDDVQVWSLKKLITQVDQITSPNVAKVVTDVTGRALYFSRSPIPFYRDHALNKGVFYKAVGMYAFSTQGLKLWRQLPYSGLEAAEKLEQLRLLEHGVAMRIHETAFEVCGIDTPQDLVAATQVMQAKLAGRD